MHTPPSHAGSRRGSAYLAVLGAAMLVAIIGLGALSVVRSQRVMVLSEVDTAAARIAARSGIEWAAQVAASDPNWRNRGSPWPSQTIGDSTVVVAPSDPSDGNLGNRPTDPLLLQATATRGRARQILQATLTATGPPLECLRMALHTAGELRIDSGMTFTATGAPASTNNALRNDGTIVGSAEALLLTSAGTITGTLTCPALSKPMPPTSVVSLYTSLGTAISPPGNTISNVVLAPGVNPWGTPSADGVYVLNAATNVTITRARINGTLVVLCAAGVSVQIGAQVFIHPARPDYPSLIIDGDVVLASDSGIPLSEAATGINFNPAGAPYSGVTDTDTTDTYPSEIWGLVHIRRSLAASGNSRIRGAVIAEATGSNAVRCSGPCEIVYDPALAANPPMGYTKRLSMTLLPGSWRQVVSP